MMKLHIIKKIFAEYEKECTFDTLYNNVYTDKFKQDPFNVYNYKPKLTPKLIMLSEAQHYMPVPEVVVKKKKGRPRKV